MKNQHHKPWIITAKAGGALDILLYDVIGEDMFGEGTTAKSFAEDLKAAGSISKIHLRVNSPGGNVFDGIAIYNMLLSSGARVTAQVDGIAASIASVILMAASEVSMNESAMLMIHNPHFTIAGGDQNDLRKMADTLNKVKSSMIAAYRRHSTQSAEQIGALMDAETWMSAAEAKANGFIQVVTDEDGEVAANFDLSMFQKVPAQIAARMAGSTSRTKRVDGENLTSEGFLYVGDEEQTDTWHLPWKFSSEEKTESHLRDALARFDQTDIPASEKPAVRAKLARLCKEHGIKVSDDKSGKALAKLTAAEKIAEAEPGECGCACLPCSEENNCQDCTDEACDEDCEGCAMQAQTVEAKTAKAKTAKAPKARLTGRLAKLAKRTPAQAAAVAREGESECGCACLPCSKENNCQDCGNADCIDDDCNDGDCPMQARASATALAGLNAKLATANKTIDSLKDELSEAVEGKTEGAATAARNLKWLARISGDLEQAEGLSASAVKDLPRERVAAESRIVQLSAELEAAQTALAAEQAARLEEAGIHAKFTERLTGELRQAGKLHAAAAEELPLLIAAAEARITEIRAELEISQHALAAEKKARVEDGAAHVQWTERMTGELSSAGKLYAGAMAELPLRLTAAEGRVTQITAELESAQTALAAEKKARVEDSTAYARSAERITAELSSAGKLYAAAPQHIAAADALVTQLTAELESAQTALLAEKKARSEDAAANVQWTGRMTAELTQAGITVEELPRRSRAAEAHAAQIATDLAATETAIDSGKKAREGAADAKTTERLIADLASVGKLYADAVEELSRRARTAEAGATQLATELAGAQTAMEAGKKARGEETAARGLEAGRVTASLEQAGTLYAAAVEELPRRARAAEARVTQLKAEGANVPDDKQAAAAGKKAEETAAAATRAEGIERMTADLKQAGTLYAAAVEDLLRRGRAAEQRHSQIKAEMESAQPALDARNSDAGKKARGEEAAARAARMEEIERMTAELQEAATIYASASEEIARRARLAQL